MDGFCLRYAIVGVDTGDVVIKPTTRFNTQANNGHILPQQYTQALFHTALDCLRRDHSGDYAVNRDADGDASPLPVPLPDNNNNPVHGDANATTQPGEQHASPSAHEAPALPSIAALPALSGPDALSPPGSPHHDNHPPTMVLPTMSHTVVSGLPALSELPAMSALGGMSLTAGHLMAGEEHGHEASSRHAGKRGQRVWNCPWVGGAAVCLCVVCVHMFSVYTTYKDVYGCVALG